MKKSEKEFALKELQTTRNLLNNVRDVFLAESAKDKDRMNHDARMHQIAGLFRHLSYLSEYINEAKED